MRLVHLSDLDWKRPGEQVILHWSVDDSQALLDHLYAQFDKPEHTFRHKWEEGDLLIWDNRCAQHSVVGDTDGARRSLHRTTIAGATPIGGGTPT